MVSGYQGMMCCLCATNRSILVVVVVDAGRSVQPQARVTEEFILNRLHDMNIPATLIFNKMDLLYEDRHLLEAVAERYHQGYPHFKKTLYISAVYEEGLDKVKVGVARNPEKGLTCHLIRLNDYRMYYTRNRPKNHGFIQQTKRQKCQI